MFKGQKHYTKFTVTVLKISLYGVIDKIKFRLHCTLTKKRVVCCTINKKLFRITFSNKELEF